MSNEPIFDALRKEYAEDLGIRYERLIAPVLKPVSILDHADWIRAKEESLRSTPFNRERLDVFKDAVGDAQTVADKRAPLEWPVPAYIAEEPSTKTIEVHQDFVVEDDGYHKMLDEFFSGVSRAHLQILEDHPGAVITNYSDVVKEADGSMTYTIEGVAPIDPEADQRYVPIPHKKAATEPGEFLVGSVVFLDTEYQAPTSGVTDDFAWVREGKTVRLSKLPSVSASEWNYQPPTYKPLFEGDTEE